MVFIHLVPLSVREQEISYISHALKFNIFHPMNDVILSHSCIFFLLKLYTRTFCVKKSPLDFMDFWLECFLSLTVFIVSLEFQIESLQVVPVICGFENSNPWSVLIWTPWIQPELYSSHVQKVFWCATSLALRMPPKEWGKKITSRFQPKTGCDF